MARSLGCGRGLLIQFDLEGNVAGKWWNPRQQCAISCDIVDALDDRSLCGIPELDTECCVAHRCQAQDRVGEGRARGWIELGEVFGTYPPERIAAALEAQDIELGIVGVGDLC